MSPSDIHLNRESTIALGILLPLILIAISCFAASRIRAHKTALRDAEAHRLSASANRRLSPSTVGRQPTTGITGYRVFKVDRDVSRVDWTGREHEAGWRAGTEPTMPRYEEGRDEG
ncbi:hypothetical protein P171DRAFT_268942 [Karstenula rhodostoma CBS 690.94]|uniref:Uncharacterized protein n=1 Tax=Karstenula rhodostoma CBS 690.94 TaxID=1392251 RepID=A0A9P4UBH9_9PLEO|nr:hypothetical protein P171DRAFT_268942 [Karstenula rhodostoma CBS 690.94]